MPKVSVIIPTYNRANYVGEAIESVLAQTYQDYEIIVVDDGSTDNTREVVQKYSDRMKYLYQDNRGEPGGRNTGILVSQGEYLVFLDSDDLLMPTKLEEQVAFLDSNPEIGVVYSDTYLCDETGRLLGLQSDIVSHRLQSGNIFEELLRGGFIPINSAMVRRACLDDVGLFDEARPMSPDWELWLRVAQRYNFAYQNWPLAVYRIHSAMVSRDSQTRISRDIAVRRKVMDWPAFQKASKAAKWDFFYDFGRLLCMTGQMAEGRSFFRRAIAVAPGHLNSYILWILSLFGNRFYRKVVLTKRWFGHILSRRPHSPIESHW